MCVCRNAIKLPLSEEKNAQDAEGGGEELDVVMESRVENDLGGEAGVCTGVRVGVAQGAVFKLGLQVGVVKLGCARRVL
jgi:hypothetical protein